MSFSDLSFQKRADGAHFSNTEINGYKLSVVAGNMMYSEPRINLESVDDYVTFECAVLYKGEFVTEQFVTNINDDVVGYMTRDDIGSLIHAIETGQKI